MTSDGTRVRKALAELIDLAHTELAGRHLNARQDLVFGGILASTSESCAALLQLADGLAARPAEVILRSILDGWITAFYVVADDSGERARSYAARELTQLKDFYRRLKRLVGTDPQNAREHLERANLTSESDLEQEIGRLDAESRELRKKGLKGFPPLAECARAMGPGFEYMYIWFYGFMLSDRAHLGPRTSLAFLSEGEYEPAFRRRQMRRVLASALTLQLSLLRLASSHFGRPSSEQLEKFDHVLEEERANFGSGRT